MSIGANRKHRITNEKVKFKNILILKTFVMLQIHL
jgi:hypothetical protein